MSPSGLCIRIGFHDYAHALTKAILYRILCPLKLEHQNKTWLQNIHLQFAYIKDFRNNQLSNLDHNGGDETLSYEITK